MKTLFARTVPAQTQNVQDRLARPSVLVALAVAVSALAHLKALASVSMALRFVLAWLIARVAQAVEEVRFVLLLPAADVRSALVRHSAEDSASPFSSRTSLHFQGMTGKRVHWHANKIAAGNYMVEDESFCGVGACQVEFKNFGHNWCKLETPSNVVVVNIYRMPGLSDMLNPCE